MELRDYFAGMVIQGVMKDAMSIREDTFDCIAEKAYKLADAMLKEREKLPTEETYQHKETK